MLKFRSVNSIVIAPAKTGRAIRSRRTVMATDQAKSGIRSSVMPGARAWKIVTRKLTAPAIEEAPAKWREKMARSTLGPFCPTSPERGGYIVHPAPTPLSTSLLISSRRRDGGRSQNLRLFSRGNAISGDPKRRGISQFPNPPIRIGITAKKIIMKAWAVTIVL